MTARRKGRGWSGAGMTRLERQLGGNTAQDRQDIATAAAVPRGRRYYQDMGGATGAAPAPKSAEPTRTNNPSTTRRENMDTTNSSENKHRRVEDRKQDATINWEAPGAPAVPLSAAANERANLPIRYVASLQVTSEGASVFTTPDATRLPHGHYMLSAGAAAAAAGWYGDLRAEPESEQLKKGRASIANYRDELHAAGIEPATSGDAPTDLQQLKVLALAAAPGPWSFAPTYADNGESDGYKVNNSAGGVVAGGEHGLLRANAKFIAHSDPAVVLGLIREIESLYNAMRLWKQNDEGAGRIERAAAPVEPLRKAEELPATASGDELPPLDFDKLQAIADRVDARGLFNASCDIREWIELARTSVSAATKPTADADDLAFNATRLRNVVRLTGLEKSVPEDDETLDGARGSVLGLIAGALRNAATSKVPLDLNSLARYGEVAEARGDGEYVIKMEDGEFYRVKDVQSLLATKPAGVPQKDTPESMANSNARFAIDGAIQYGRENRNQPPSTNHWLYEYWNIGRQLNEAGRTGWDNVTPLAPTAAPADQAEKSDHVRNLIEYAEDAVRDMRTWMSNYGDDEETNDLIANIENTVRALKSAAPADAEGASS